jgi:hypothetical protein
LSNGYVTAVGLASDSVASGNSELRGNSFTSITDDGVEVDAANNINSLIMDNTFAKVRSAMLSVAPNQVGPVFFLFNRGGGHERGVKGSNGTNGIAVIQHNTFAPDPAAIAQWNPVNFGAGGTHRHTYFTNNLFIGKSGATRVINGQSSGDSAQIRTNEFNFNAYDNTGVTNLYTWAGTNYTLTSIRSTFNHEQNGLTGTAVLGGINTYNYRLLSTSVGVDDGRRLTGVNTAFGRLLYKGTAPDCGALEVGSSTPGVLNLRPWHRRRRG